VNKKFQSHVQQRVEKKTGLIFEMFDSETKIPTFCKKCCLEFCTFRLFLYFLLKMNFWQIYGRKIRNTKNSSEKEKMGFCR